VTHPIALRPTRSRTPLASLGSPWLCLLLAACATTSSAGSELEGSGLDGSGEGSADTGDVGGDGGDVAPDTITPDTTDDTDDGSGDGSGDPGPTLLGLGEPCSDDVECATDLCVAFVGGGGICAEPCGDAGGCDVGFVCLLVGTAGDEQRVCLPEGLCVDPDGDGFGVGPGCLAGVDCEPGDALINPRASELCDGLDNDCDGQVDDDTLGAGGDCETGFLGVCAAGTQVCASGSPSCEPDTLASDEVCDGLDNDCDGEVDEAATGGLARWFLDTDGDGWGDSAAFVDDCTGPPGYVANSGDCNEGDPFISPAAPEIDTNEVDENCNGFFACFSDADGDGYGRGLATDTWATACGPEPAAAVDGGDCNDNVATISPAAVDLANDELDNNCDGAWNCVIDGDDDGYGTSDRVTALAPRGLNCTVAPNLASNADDCDDTRPDVSPRGSESAGNDADENCDGQRLCFVDSDRDGYGGGSTSTTAGSCGSTPGLATLGGDCNDADGRRTPGRAEACDGIDNDCDGAIETVSRRGRNVEYHGNCIAYSTPTSNDTCFGEAWGGSGYMFCHYHNSWNGARAACADKGMRLVSIESEDENQNVMGIFNDQDGEAWDDLWLGGRETGSVRSFTWDAIGTLFWANGGTGNYTRWRSGEPSNDSGGGGNDCVSARQSDFAWNDRNCDGAIEFICEW
jgi:hypothetical protein